MVEKRLSFQVLKKDVIDKGTCAACYGCVSFCTANDLNILTIRGDEPIYLDEGNCLECGICYLICPRTTVLDNAIEARYKYKDPIGFYNSVRCLQTIDEKIAKVCCDGGLVTSLLKFLIDTKRIDGAIISKKESLWSNQPMIATNFEDLLEGAGSSLSQSKSVADMGDLTTYATVFGAFKGAKMLDITKLAVVGTPCQIQTIRKMQLLRIVPSQLVRLTIGLFCFENFLMHEEGRRYLEGKIRTDLDEIAKINLKDNFVVNLKDGRTQHIDLEKLEPITRPACLSCTDFSNFAADISVGGLGSPDGYTTTLVRNLNAQKLLDEAIATGYLQEIEQKGIIEKIEVMARRKRKRGEALRKERRVHDDT